VEKDFPPAWEKTKQKNSSQGREHRRFIIGYCAGKFRLEKENLQVQRNSPGFVRGNRTADVQKKRDFELGEE